MRVLGIGDWNDLGSMYLRLSADAHDVRVYIAEPEATDILAGFITRVDDWHDSLSWIREAGKEGFIVFETAKMGKVQDQLRRDGYQVVGGSALGDRLERERSFGQQILREHGMRVLPSWDFHDSASGEAFIRAKPGRYVLKYDAGSDLICQTYVGRSADGADVIALLSARGTTCRGRFLLMEHRDGVEVGVGAYFNGERFLAPACLDWEHKRFFPGDLGELTGEMGTLVTYSAGSTLFEQTLGRLAPCLKAGGYCGYINLNTIVDEDGIWPLEFTSRFGYPGFAILSVLQQNGWADLLQRLCDPASTFFPVLSGYAVGVVLTVPPFPYHYGYESLSKGLGIAFTDLTQRDHDHLHFGEVAQTEHGLCCAGVIGAVMTVTGSGGDAAAARSDAYRRVDKVVIPNMRYRADIGKRFIASDRARLMAWGLLS